MRLKVNQVTADCLLPLDGGRVPHQP
jgi:hypothetical protein